MSPVMMMAIPQAILVTLMKKMRIIINYNYC